MRNDRGFTLAELLVSLVVMALLGAMIVSGVSTGRRVWERMDANAGRREAVEGAQMALRNRLERAFPATRYDASAPYADFEGNAKGVAFLGPASDAGRPSALRRYTLGLATSGDLVLSSVSDVAVENGARESLVLLRGVQTIDIAYFGSTPPDNVPRWHLDWATRPTLPELVRIRVQFADGAQGWWPDLIVHPMATVDSRCVLDLRTHRCKGRA